MWRRGTHTVPGGQVDGHQYTNGRRGARAGTAGRRVGWSRWRGARATRCRTPRSSSRTGPARSATKARGNVIAEYAGLPLELVRVEIGDDVEEHPGLTLYRRSRKVVRRTDTGDPGVLPLMDTLVEMGGGWKFMNFVDDR